MYFKDSRSLLVIFVNRQKRDIINERLQSMLTGSSSLGASTPGLLKTPFSKFGARILSGLREDGLATAQRKWQAREISNVRHKSHLAILIWLTTSSTPTLAFLTKFLVGRQATQRNTLYSVRMPYALPEYDQHPYFICSLGFARLRFELA